MASTEGKETMYLLTKSGVVLGRCVHYPRENGWRFLPNTDAHKPGRKARPSATDCIPEWAFDLSDELLTASEWVERTSKQH